MSRLKAYDTHNPDYQLLGVIDGDKTVEKEIHNKFSYLRVKGFKILRRLGVSLEERLKNLNVSLKLKGCRNTNL